MKEAQRYSAIVIGCSAGGLHALIVLLEDLPLNCRVPIVIVQHRSKDERELLEVVLRQRCAIPIRQADEKEAIANGYVYIAPPDYHLLVEQNRTFSLSTDEKVNYARPSIDVLFETAAEVYTDKLAGVILTGANSDGCQGVKAIHRRGGFTIAQDPREAEFPAMPLAAVKSGDIDRVLSLADIKMFLSDQATT